MIKYKRILAGAFLLGVLFPALVFCVPSAEPVATTYRVTSRAQLIGGPRALGEVGDFLMENDQIRLVVQDKGYSRGFGIYGGNLIDADLVRARGGKGDSATANGYDNFGEMFPSFFLEAMEPNRITIVDDDDSEESAAAREACGLPAEGHAALHILAYGSDFLAMTESINEVLLGDNRTLPALQFDTCYRLAPGKRYVEIDNPLHKGVR